jgi:hypothetical protein
MQEQKISLRNFLARKLGSKIVECVLDPSTKSTNSLTIDEFVLVTRSSIRDVTLHRLIGKYYGVPEEIGLSASRYLWITRDDAERLLVVILNYSDSQHGAEFFGGPSRRGGIGIEVIRHAVDQIKTKTIQGRQT